MGQTEDAHAERVKHSVLSALNHPDTRLTVKEEVGSFRWLHVRPGADMTWFQIVTFPMVLVYTGDMGTYVFQRTADMFEFFRSPPELRINPTYWEQKLEAVDKTDGVREFDPLVALDDLRDTFEEYNPEAWPDIEADPPQCPDDVYRLLDDAGLPTDECGTCGERYTHRYLWALWAIVWTIQRYDKLKEETQHG